MARERIIEFWDFFSGNYAIFCAWQRDHDAGISIEPLITQAAAVDPASGNRGGSRPSSAETTSILAPKRKLVPNAPLPASTDGGDPKRRNKRGAGSKN